jgi:hypothetical protein
LQAAGNRQSAECVQASALVRAGNDHLFINI